MAGAALARCHFGPDGSDLRSACQAACYDCLLSFGNQFEAFSLDRHRVSDLLRDLAASRTSPRTSGRSRGEHLRWLRSLTDSRSELERRLLDALHRGGHRLPDDAQRRVPAPVCIPDFFYEPNVCIFCDGSVHDDPSQMDRDRQVRGELRDRGYRVVVVRYDERIQERIAQFPDIFGCA